MSRATCHVWHVTCHMSCVTCHILFFIFSGRSSEAIAGEGPLSRRPTPSSFNELPSEFCEKYLFKYICFIFSNSLEPVTWLTLQMVMEGNRISVSGAVASSMYVIGLCCKRIIRWDLCFGTRHSQNCDMAIPFDYPAISSHIQPFQPLPAMSSHSQPFPASSSLFQPISAYSI